MAPALRRAALAGIVAAAFLSLLAARARRDPGVVFLNDRPGARWIALDEPFVLKATPPRPRFVRFRARVVVPAGVPAAELSLRARSQSQVVFDGREVLPPGGAGPREERRVLLSAAPGARELLVVVRAEDGPSLLWARAPEWDLATGTSWEAEVEGGLRGPARDAAAARRWDAFFLQTGAAYGFARTCFWPLLFGLLAAFAAPLAPGRVALASGVAWLALGAATFARWPEAAGFDSLAHLEYARGLWATGRLPGPGDGWQSFQAPLYYLVCAPLSGAVALARAPNLVAGFILGLACADFARAARPGRPAHAAAAGLFGWFWAANLSMSQSLGNEPFAGALGALFLVLCARTIAEARASDGRAAALGALAGAALFAKATAILVLPAGLAGLWSAVRPRRARLAATFALAAFAAGGWFYARSWILYGTPFVAGWDPSRGMGWVQAPGYRTAGDFLRFGEALWRPLYAGVAGFWDALYSSFWLDGWNSGIVNPDTPVRPATWQAAAAWWGVWPCALIVVGAARAFKTGDKSALLSVAVIGTGLAALLWLFLALPVYSTVKASYLLAAGPAFALLLADGLEAVPARWRKAGWGLLAAWAACAWRAHLPL